MQKIHIPCFEPVGIALENGVRAHLADPPIEVEPYDHNHVRIHVGDSTRLVEGVALATAVNECIGRARARRG